MTVASPNTQIQPMTFETNPASLGGIPLARLAEQYGTPLYIMDEKTVRTMMQTYVNAFKAYPGKVKVYYAAKANLNMALCALAHQENLGIDVVSGGEYYTALQAGFPTDDILFNGNNKTPSELTLAIGQGIGKISVDNFHELALINDIAARQGKKVDIILRITPGIECHTHDYIKTGSLDSKFGFTLSQLNTALDQITQDYANTLQLCGLHAHIGSQIFELQSFHDLVEVMLNLFQRIRTDYGLTLTHLNLGGGVGISYQSQDDPPQVADYAKVVIDKMVSYAEEIDYPLPTLFLEPGRSLVATSGITLYTIGSTKFIPELNKTYLAVDGGMGDNIRPALYQSVYTATVINKPNEDTTKTVTLAGKYCESGDILIRELKVPESVKAGDLLVVFGTGAYNYSMSSQYNRVPRPAMVLVNDGQSYPLIQRETWDDVLSHDLMPTHLTASSPTLALS